MQRRDFVIGGLATIAGTICSAMPRVSWQPLPLIIDADTANEVDDLFAIARALLAPELDIKGLTAAQWHTSPLAGTDTVTESHRINSEILQLMGRTHVPNLLGSNHPMVSQYRPQASPASDFIIEQARSMAPGVRLQVAVLGPCTNVASAVLSAPDIIDKLHVHYIGFWYDVDSDTWNKREFNTNNDPNAVNALLNTPTLPMSIMTATTSKELVFTRKVANNYLQGKGGIGDYLMDHWEAYPRHWQPDDPHKTWWTMWDVALIEALIAPHHATTRQVLTPYDNSQRQVEVYARINAAAMEASFWKAMQEYLP